MAINTNLGGVFTTDIESGYTSNVFVSTENVVGLIFDTSIVGGLAKALGTDTLAAETFANGNVVELNTQKDITAAGIDDKVLCGVALYHLESFFSLAGGNQRIFVSFMDSTSDAAFEAVERMQLAASGIIFQIGVWTGKPIASKVEGGDYEIITGNPLAKLSAVADTLGGVVGQTNYEGNAPVNILVNCPIVNEAVVDLAKLPDVSLMNYPKVSVLLGQAPSTEVRKIMFDVNHAVEGTKNYMVVGNIGMALGCLASAPANESIAHVNGFNLASVTQNAELGFGNIVNPDNATEYGAASSFTNIKALGYNKRNSLLHKKGYIFLTNYDGLENSIFFSSDQTLSTGDYRTISRCRVMHKSRRVVRRALLPYVNEDWELDSASGTLSVSSITQLQNVVLEALDVNMVEPGTSVPQISGRSCIIDEDQDVLHTDALNIQYALVPHGVTSAIYVTEGFNTVS